MKNDKVNNVKLGVFVIVAFALFIAGIYYIGSRQNLFGSSFALSAVFDDVNGLQPGNTVRYAGINVGSVESINILNDTMIRVDMNIQDKVKSYIKKGSLAKIGTDGLVGNVIVEISAGEGSKNIVEDGDMLMTKPQVKTDKLLQNLSDSGDNMTATTENLMKITNEIKEGNGMVGTLINDEKIALELIETLHNLNHATKSLNSMVQKTASYVEDIENGKSTLGYLLKDTSLAGQIAGISTDIDNLIKVRTEPFLNSLLKSGENMEQSTAKFKDLITQLDGGDNLISLLATDTKSANEVKEMINNLNEGTAKFNDVMEALKHNFLVRGFFKDKEKKEKEN